MKTNIESLSEKEIKDSLIFNISNWMTTKEAATYLRLSESALRTLIHRYPNIPRYKLGRSLRFKRKELDKLIESSLLVKKEGL